MILKMSAVKISLLAMLPLFCYAVNEY